MARQATIKVLRTTRSALDTQAGASGLIEGEPYLITDEGRFAIATSASAYSTFRRMGENVENGLVNGGFDFWQRGTSFTATGYTADRWLLQLGSGAAITLTRQSFSLGQTDVPGEPEFYTRMVRATAGSTVSILTQRMKGVRQFAGQTVTLTFWAKASAATTLKSRFNQRFGTGGSPSGNVNTALVDHSLTTSWQKFTSVVSIPSISGKTLGTDGKDHLEVEIEWPHDSNATGTVEIARASVVPGNAAAEADVFPRRHASVEQVMCEAFYETGGAFLSSGLAGNGARGYYVPFRTKKHFTPTLATSSEDGSPTVDQVSTERFRALNGAGNQFSFNWTADCEL